MPVVGKLSIGMQDDSEDPVSTMTVNVAELTAGNFAGQETDRNAFIVAVNGLSLGSNVSNQASNIDRVVDPGTLGTGQREVKLEVIYSDTVSFRRYPALVPVFDPDLRVAGKDDINTALVQWTDFVTAFEAYVLSPAGNPTSVISGKLVGRNI